MDLGGNFPNLNLSRVGNTGVPPLVDAPESKHRILAIFPRPDKDL